jgi:hypothetical protein
VLRLLFRTFREGIVTRRDATSRLEPLIDPMFHSEHFLARSLKRHNNWEIHPVLKIEYCAEEDTCDPKSDENWLDGIRLRNS